MPNGLPDSTVVTSSEHVRIVGATRFLDGPRFVMILYGDKIEPLYRGADQDGWLGEVICRYRGNIVAVPPRCLKL
jgi:hypothetical protein